MPLTFALPLPPNMANGRMHWRVKDRERKRYFVTCDIWQLMAPTLAEPLPFAEIHALLRVHRLHDDDNAMARIKWSVDWLVSRGYLAGDSRKYVRWRGLPEQQAIRRADVPEVIVTLTPITPVGA